MSPAALAAGLLVLLASGLLWHSVVSHDDDVLRSTTRAELDLLASELGALLHGKVDAIERMAQRWRAGPGTPEGAWRADARNYLTDMPGLLALAVVPDDRWLVPEQWWLEVRRGVLVDRVPPVLAGAEPLAGDTAQPTVANLSAGLGSDRVVLLRVALDDRHSMVGMLDVGELLDYAVPASLARRYGYQLADPGGQQIGAAPVDPAGAAPFLLTQPVAFGASQWQLRLWPRPAFIDGERTWDAALATLVALLLALLVGVATQGWVNALRAAAHLRDNEQRMGLILEHAGEGIYGVDRHGNTTFCNRGAAEVLGYRPEEMIGVNQHALIHHHHADGSPYPVQDCNIYKAIHDGLVHTETEEVFWHRDGHAVAVEYTSSPMLGDDGRPVGAVVVFRDVSQVRRIHRLFRDVYSLSLAAERPVAERVHEALDLLVGFLGCAALRLAVLRDDGTSRLLVTAGPQPDALPSAPGPRTDNVALLPDGADTLLRVPVTVGAERSGVLEIARPGAPDSVLRQHLAAIQIVAQWAGSEIGRADTLQSLAETNEELEQFAYVASHDLKAPLRVIDNASQWLAEDLAEHLDDDTRETLALLQSRVRRMEALLDDLLAYSRIGRVREEGEDEYLAGDDLVHAALAIASPPAAFRVELAPMLNHLRLPRMPLTQVFVNLLTNAVKHHNRGDGTISIDVSVRDSDLVFAVTDDGPGIPEAYRERVFEMFQTLKPRDQVEGSGMGLALVRKRLDVIGGSIWLENPDGGGARFCFSWPRRLTRPVPRPGAAPAEGESEADDHAA